MNTVNLDLPHGQDASAQRAVGCRILACFNAEETERFLGGDASALERVAVAAGSQLYLTTPPQTEEQWQQLVLEVKPEVIVGAWSLPPIPDSLAALVPQFKYLCYFCGSIRGKVSAHFIARGGLVTNWGALAADAVAECAVALVLACARRMSRYTLEMHIDKTYNGLGNPWPLSISGRSVGIHGVGTVARNCARLLRPFGGRIECWSQAAPAELYTQAAVNRARSLESLFTDNDIVIEAEALNEQSEGSVTAQLLCAMKPGAIFVNVGRGAVLEAGAVEALAARGDVAVGLDVYRDEPLPAGSVLRGMRNVMLLPHTAGPTVDQYGAICEQSLSFLRDYLGGRVLKERISVQAYHRMT